MDVAHWYLKGNADAVEFCPYDSYLNVLAVSTYTLQEGSQPSRQGSISLFNVDVDTPHLDLLFSEETAGIFDIKWSPPQGHVNPLLAQADADGYLRIKMLEGCCNGVEGVNLKEMSNEKMSNSMCLYLDWNSSATCITVGLSDGSVSIVSVLESKLEIQQEWKAHDFEVWTTSFDTHQPNLVYTGSDDCKFSCWDLRDRPPNVVFQSSKVHKMGVTCIEKSPHDPNILLTGSYDEFLRVWDLRSISKPLNNTSIGLGEEFGGLSTTPSFQAWSWLHVCTMVLLLLLLKMAMLKYWKLTTNTILLLMEQTGRKEKQIINHLWLLAHSMTNIFGCGVSEFAFALRVLVATDREYAWMAEVAEETSRRCGACRRVAEECAEYVKVSDTGKDV
ncbi:hypothetical protein ACSQ67_024092 [Phaseolus vulgaris]